MGLTGLKKSDEDKNMRHFMGLSKEKLRPSVKNKQQKQSEILDLDLY